MEILWWVIFSLNVLFASGIMLTYLGRRTGNGPSEDHTFKGDKEKALVILPIKGVDYKLEENLRSLKDQEWQNYDIIAVVDSDKDEALPFLRREGINYMISGEVCVDCSGKVRAILSALTKHRNYDFYVVADSDIRVESNWLSKLLVQLHDPKIGVSTTFPLFYPEGGFWSKFKMFWGSVGQSMMESNLTKFVWGGSMAFRKDFVDERFIEQFSHSISDDIAVLRIAKSRGLEISYVPDARPKVHSKDDFRTFMEWSNRQTSFSIYSTRKVFVFGMIYYLVYIYLLLSSIVLAIYVNLIFIIFMFPFLFNSVNTQRKLPVKMWYFIIVTFILPFIYSWNLIQGMLRGSVSWRGSVYLLSRNNL
ncbi:MAG: glycosyltransferase family 2 protein [Thermoplasmatales archaeon]